MEDTILTLAEVQKYLKLGRSTIYNMAEKGELPTFHMGERGTRVRLSELNAWIEERKVKKAKAKITQPNYL